MTKTVLVTGGTGALGSQVVRALLAAANRVAVVYVVPTEWERLLNDVGEDRQSLIGLQGDVLSPGFMESAVTGALERFGRLDGLLHLMGGYAYAPLMDTTPDVFRRMIGLNLESAVVAARAAAPALRESRGVIVFTGAQGAIDATPNQAAYNVSKAGVIALARTLARELKSDGIRVNAIAPDIIDTPANRRSMPRSDFSRWLTPQQVADVLVNLISDASSAVDGAVLNLTHA